MSAVIIRVSAATLLLGVVGTSVVPYATSYVSTSAVINAPIIIVRAPFDGVVTAPSKAIASAVVAGGTLMDLHNSHSQQTEVLSLVTSRDALSGEIAGLVTQIQNLEDMWASLNTRRMAEIDARLLWFVPRLQEADAEVQRAQARLAQAQTKSDRVAQLAAGGLAILDTIDAAEVEMLSATADLTQQNAVLARLVVERDMLAGSNGVDLSSTVLEQINARLDDISIRIADLNARSLERQTMHAGLNAQINALSSAMNSQENFTPMATASGVIWDASVGAGASVTAGDTILKVLDCSRRFLEVTLPERHFEGILPGAIANVTLSGSSDTFPAIVVATYGSGVRENTEYLATHSQTETIEGFRVIVELDGVDVSNASVARSFCDVGRTAEVRFNLPDTSVMSRAKSVMARFFGTDHDVGQDIALNTEAP